ncbi:1-acyl-sn-glycerol-3-phosphate acyltransferase epsilon-like [Acanthaster planci]|uniref:1-acyl-sn-glycerol-3-phosphate acyltransferase epsilon-like n=1 Tax=Acanthaster planci TaxID=133434 RepID=A0A8B7YDD0_ACAPL|nr:1-acyl-sn-glycerol-3-phosphate acyltransferase epsilon-like [Acanthaster planci]
MLSVIAHLNSLKFVAPAVMMMGSAPPYFVLFSGWKVVSCLLPERWHRAVDDCLWGTYQRLVEFFFENYTGTEVVLYGDVEALDRSENVIYMCNHQTTMDWVVADMIAIRGGMLGNMRFVLKDGLKYMPLYGWEFGQHGGIYVKRDKKFDQKNRKQFRKRLDVLRKNDIPTWLIVFPEGTRYNPLNGDLIRASQAFAFKNGLAVTNHVLSPRIKAVNMCIQGLRGHTAAVYDVTIAYSNTGEECSSLEMVERRPAPGMPEFLQLRCPRIHVHIRRIPMETIPEDEESCHRWLHELFEEKDNMLSDFYSNNTEKRGRLEGEGRSTHLGLLSTLPAVAFSCALLAPLVGTSYGRQLYWKIWLFGSLAGITWMKLTT